MVLFDLVIPAEFSNVGSAGNLPIIPPPTAEFSIMRPFNIPDSVFKATLEPRFPITAALLYVIAVVALNKYNRSRDAKPWPMSKKPWFLKFVIMHNALLAVYSAWTFCGMVGVLRRTLVSPGGAEGLSATYDSLCRIHGPAGLGRSIYFDETLGRWTSVDAELSFAAMNGTYPLSMPSGRIWSEGMAYYGWLFYVSKVYEFLDTFIILAKGKESSFLQIYHHSGVLVGTWLGYRVMASPAWILVFLNSFVHSLMYTYYVSQGISIRVPIAVKRSLTLLQIIQFVVGGVFGVIHFFIEFDNPTITAITKLYGDDDASPSIISAYARQPSGSFILILFLVLILPTLLILIMHVKIARTAALAGLILATTFADGKALQTTSIGKHNDFSCQPSADHPSPVVLLHGLGATYYDDLHVLEAFLQTRGFCTFSLTYGALEGRPFLGGFAPIDESSRQIADFIHEVHAKTVGTGGGSTRKIDIVGHSEGGFQALYVPKFREGVAALVDHIVAIAPPTHGTPIANLLSLSPLLGHDAGILELIGCAACDELSIGGASVVRLNDGKAIVQPGNKVTVIISRLDAIVIPPESAFIYEDGVDNIRVQDYCPLDLVGHISETYDFNIWNLVLNSLENQVGRKFPCLGGGLPVK